MRSVLLLVPVLLVLAACSAQSTPEQGWSDVPTALVTPSVAGAADLVEWATDVANAVEEWNVRLDAAGCPKAFEVGEDGHDVKGWLAVDWPHPTHYLGLTDLGPRERMDVVANLPVERRHLTIMHELGHAMGLVHTGREGLMNARVGEVLEADVGDACLVLALH